MISLISRLDESSIMFCYVTLYYILFCYVMLCNETENCNSEKGNMKLKKKTDKEECNKNENEIA